MTPNADDSAASDAGGDEPGADTGTTDAGGDDRDAAADGRPPMEAVRYDDGTITYPAHTVGRGGGEPVDTIDLSEHTAEVVTWTTSTATPPGVREPNTLAIVEFEVEGDAVRAIGQVDGNVAIGETVRPVYVPELRDPDAGLRVRESQAWGGYRFEPIPE